MSNLSTTQVIGLTTTAIDNLMERPFGPLTATQARQVVGGPTWSAEHNGNLTSLTATQAGALTSTQVGGSTTTNFAALSTTGITALSTTAIAGISVADIEALIPRYATHTGPQIGVLSADQLSALVDFGLLADRRAKVVCVSQTAPDFWIWCR